MQRRRVRKRKPGRHRAGQRRAIVCLGGRGWVQGDDAGPDCLDHIRRTAHQHRPVADQHVASGRPRIKRMARHRQHVAPLVQRRSGGDQTAGSRGRFDHDHSAHKARHDPVAQREMPRLRHRTHRLFGQKADLRDDLSGQIGVFFGVDHIYPACLHRKRSRGQRSHMRFRINTAGQS